MNCENRTFAALNQRHFLPEVAQPALMQNHRGNWVLQLIKDMLTQLFN
jgi:hypothetical protein